MAGNKILSCGLLMAFMLGAQTQTGNVPRFHLDPSWPKMPSKWKMGEASSMAVDTQDRVWLLQRPRSLKAEEASMAAPPVLVFDTAGNFVQGWGGPGSGYEWPEREHGIHVDYKGFVWITGNNCPARNIPGLKPVSDDQLLKFTPAGKFVMQIGHSNKSGGNADTESFNQPAEVFVYRKTNEVFVADGYGNHRVIVLDADSGKFKRMWGAFGNVPVDLDQCPPPNNIKSSDEQGPPQFSIVHTIRVSNDGLVYAGDRTNKRIQVFTIDGKFVRQVVRPSTFAWDIALSPDKEQRFLYAGGSKEVYVLDRKTLEIVETIKVDGLVEGGHEMAVDSKGNMYLAQLNHGIQKFVFEGMSPPKP